MDLIYAFCHFLYRWHREFYFVFLLCLLVVPVPFILLQKKKFFFILLILLPLFGEGFYTGITYGAWRYRMQLREQCGRQGKARYDLSLMAPDKKAEYAKYDYHPRLRNVKGALVRIFLLIPLYWAGVAVVCLLRQFQKSPKV